MTETVNAVLVGCGGISRAWLQASVDVPGLRIAGLVDIAREAAETRAAEFGLDDALVDSDLGAVLDRIGPDVVFNCTVPEAHGEVTLAALAHGCHVLSEKPLADSMERAREMVAASTSAALAYPSSDAMRNAQRRTRSTWLKSCAIRRSAHRPSSRGQSAQCVPGARSSRSPDASHGTSGRARRPSCTSSPIRP